MKVFVKPIPLSNIPQVHEMILEEDHSLINHTMGFIPALGDIKRQIVNDPDFDQDLFLGAYVEKKLTGCILGIRRPWKEGQEKTGYIKFILIKKHHRRAGFGRILLAACESALKKRGSTTLLFGSSSPLYFFPGVPKEADELYTLLKANGWQYQSERISLFMRLNELSFGRSDLDALLKEKSSLTLQSANPEEDKEVTAFVEHEFSASWAKEACAAIHNPDNAFCLILRNTESQEVIGFAAVNGTNPNWFGPMGVRSALRKQGLGHLLVYHALLTARDKGMTHLLIPWINGKQTFYSDFVIKTQWQVYYKFEKQF